METTTSPGDEGEHHGGEHNECLAVDLETSIDNDIH
jgi:hypothetical protein